MTFLPLIVGLYRKLNTYLDKQYTYESMEHLDDRLLKDIGFIRQNGKMIPINSLPSAQSDLENLVDQSKVVTPSSLIDQSLSKSPCD